jgi:cbb3-type cytochrome oxidase subunit 3
MTMTLFSILSSAMTVVTFVAFVAIVAWAYGRHRHEPYRHAAHAPFALPDDLPHDPKP